MSRRRDRAIAEARDTVLGVFLDDPLRPRYGYDLWRETGVRSGRLYQVLAQLVFAGWLTREREQAGPLRRRRMFYQLTRRGQAYAQARAEEQEGDRR